MAPARLALGLLAAVPALALGALLMANGATDPSRAGLLPLLMGALILAGVALAVLGIQRGRPAWVPVGAAAMIVGSTPLFLGGIGIVVVLSAVALVATGRPEAPDRAWRWAARGLAVATVLVLAWLARSALAPPSPPSPVDAILWLAALGLLAAAWWPTRRASLV